jgi:hypothetical protein
MSDLNIREEVKEMKKAHKTALIVAGGLVGLALLTHVVVNYLVPLIMRMHGAAAY